jgi:hypothetical protein
MLGWWGTTNRRFGCWWKRGSFQGSRGVGEALILGVWTVFDLNTEAGFAAFPFKKPPLPVSCYRRPKTPLKRAR